MLTKLIHQEVDLEIRQGLRSLNVEVDFHSDKVIQVGSYFMYHKQHFSIKILEAEKNLDFFVSNMVFLISVVGSLQSWMRML